MAGKVHHAFACFLSPPPARPPLLPTCPKIFYRFLFWLRHVVMYSFAERNAANKNISRKMERKTWHQMEFVHPIGKFFLSLVEIFVCLFPLVPSNLHPFRSSLPFPPEMEAICVSLNSFQLISFQFKIFFFFFGGRNNI